MKLFSYILGFYILILACMPCADTDADCLKNNQTTVTQANHHKESEEHSETCSPLCICACCGQQVAFNIFSASIKYIKPFEVEKQDPVCNQSLVCSYYGNIWQPPKLS